MKVAGDLLHAWRVSLPIDELADEIQYLFLPFGQFHGFTIFPLKD
jgi:hypothetical protein